MTISQDDTPRDEQEQREARDILAEAREEQHRLLMENYQLRETVARLMQELEAYRQPPLLVGTVRSILNDQELVVRLPNGNVFLTRNSLKEALSVGDEVYLEQKNLTVVRKAGRTHEFDVEQYVIIEKPRVSWEDIGGLDEQKQAIREVVELPLLKKHVFEKIGITPPKGVLLHGPPGTGKTLLAKAVASATNATFIELVGSELVQKYIGEGAKLVREVFKLARERAPSIIFIDELDAIAAKRIELGTSGEREVQRTFMQLLAEIDGFQPLGDVKIIAATNRPDILDPAITRPGRLERQIHVPPPGRDGVLEILRIHTRQMRLAENVNLEQLAGMLEGLTGAEIKAVVTEAGYEAIRQDRDEVRMEDFAKAAEAYQHEEEKPSMFG